MKFLKLLSFLALFLCQAKVVNAQIKMGDNPKVINPGSMLELEATNKGLLLPRISLASTGTSSLAGGGHVAGMVVYNTATAGDVTPGYYYNDGRKWVRIADAASVSAEPWFNVATNTGATANTQNIYQLGNVGIGTKAPAERLDVNGNIRCNAVILTSDATLKQDITPLSGVLPGLLKIGAYSYHWKDQSMSPDLQYGVLAQEIEKVFPHLVVTHDDHKAFNYNQLIPLLLQAIKEQQTQIDFLLKQQALLLANKTVQLSSSNKL